MKSSGAVSFRDAGPDDLETLVDLHVRLWARTYPSYKPPPSHELRRQQWQRAFSARASGSPTGWFCAVLALDDGRPVGFSKGIPAVHPEFDGELSKIYLEWSHHGRGIGRRLFLETVRRMLDHGLGSMLLFADPGNPHIAFYERMGGERLPDAEGACSANFAWRDLDALVRADGEPS